jgi:hypothetical protein
MMDVPGDKRMLAQKAAQKAVEENRLPLIKSF